MKSKKPKALRLDIDVTQDSIDNAMKQNSSHCMVADAIKKAYPNLRFVAVDIQTIRYTDPESGYRHICLTPRAIQQHIIDFDQGKPPEPFQVQVRPTQIIKAGNGKKGALISSAPASEAEPNLPLEPSKSKKRTKKPRPKREPARLVMPKDAGGANGILPIVVGGKAPPQMSTRREFGVRS